MKSPSKQLIKHSMIYGTSDMLNRILAFLLIPIYTRFLDPDVYGILQIFVIIANIGLVVVQMGLSSAIFKSILYNQNADKQTVKPKVKCTTPAVKHSINTTGRAQILVGNCPVIK